MGFAGCGVSLWTTTAITVHRFLAPQYQLQYPNLMTTSRAIYTIVTIWCIITLFSFLFIWSPSVYHYFVSAFGITISSKLTCLFHQESPTCLSASVANSRSTTSNSTKRKFNWYKYTANTTINVECKKCFYIFPRDDFMLLSIFNCCNYFRFY